MQNTNFQSGMKVIKQVLTNEVNAIDNSIADRQTDISFPGILLDVLDSFNIVPGTNSTATLPSVTVQTGIAYNANGERIIISNATVPYNSANPATTTPDGVGGNTSTPISTGSLNIALPVNTTRYLFIDYLQTTDPSAFTIHKVTGQKLFYSQTDGYKIGVSSTPTVPAGFSSASLFLGSVITNNSLVNGISSINTTGVPIFGIHPQQVQVQTPQLNKADATTVYASGLTTTLDAHVRAVGTGVVTPFNPHGLSGSDIGVSALGGVEHQEFLHCPGIISPATSGNSSALFMSIFTSGIANENFVQILPFTSQELAVVDGVTIDSGNIGSTLQFSFVDTNNNPLPNGVHTFYLDSVTKTVLRALPGTFVPGAAVMRLWDIQWTNPTLVFSSANDYRLFGTLTGSNMRFELLGALDTGLATGNRTLTFAYDLSGNLIQMAVGGDNGTISGNNTLVTFSYNIGGNLIQVGSNYGHRTLLTTITYTGTTVSQITEQVI